MADLISRAAAIEAFTGKPPEYYHTSYIVGELNSMPAVDAVPVVRCRDCMYFRPWRHDRGDNSRCEFWNTEMGAEDYCSQAIYLNNGRNDNGKDA